MLKSLFVQNYALISHLEIDFNSGLSILSGETGAGKSILLGALSLILGQRADTSVLNDKSTKCIVEGTFDLEGYDLEPLFRENDLDYDKNTIIRREVSSQGKSRAFVNDTPVGLSILKEMGDKLVDIHSQHENLLLAQNAFQLSVVDHFSGLHKQLSGYQTVFNQFRAASAEFLELKASADKARADLDYYQFQYDQIEKANLSEGDQEDLESELETLLHAEDIKSSLIRANFVLSGEEINLLEQLRELQIGLEKIASHYRPAEELARRIESAYLELKDLSEESERSGMTIEYDPQRIENIQVRLNLIYELQQKHQVKDIPGLMEVYEDLRSKIDNLSNIDFRLEELEKRLTILVSDLEERATDLTDSRKTSIPEMEKRITELLIQVGIPNARFSIKHEILTEYTATGRDAIHFLFSANKQGNLMDLSKVASGGELSRVMLSLKSLLTGSAAVPTIIFDEIDAGVSGEIADKVGNIIKGLSKNTQIINITHLPQIASKGEQHYKVYKEDREDKTVTLIKLLDYDERIVEIARMLSGEQVTDAAFQNARDLLKN
jgi:DNA repair protein RecN (Recombination protein N)